MASQLVFLRGMTSPGGKQNSPCPKFHRQLNLPLVFRIRKSIYGFQHHLDKTYRIPTQTPTVRKRIKYSKMLEIFKELSALFERLDASLKYVDPDPEFSTKKFYDPPW